MRHQPGADSCRFEHLRGGDANLRMIEIRERIVEQHNRGDWGLGTGDCPSSRLRRFGRARRSSMHLRRAEAGGLGAGRQPGEAPCEGVAYEEGRRAPAVDAEELLVEPPADAALCREI